MLVLTNIKFAVSSLWYNKARSALTMLGVIIGVFSVITLVSIGEGVRDEFAKQIMTIGSNIVIITPSQIDTKSQEFNPVSLAGVSTLTKDDVAALQKDLTDQEGIAYLMNLSSQIKNGETISRSTIVLGTQPELISIMNIDQEQGRFLESADLDNKNKVVVLGDKARNLLFGDEQQVIDKKITINNQEFTVVGTLKKKNQASGFGDTSFDNIVLIPFTTAEDITNTTSIFRILIKAKSPEQVVKIETQAKEIMQRQHNNNEDYSILTQQDILGMFDKFFGVLSKAISGIAAISLIVGGIGIMNIMLVSVSERTREIGIRKAIGATATNILSQFLIEAAVLSCFGGAIGVFLSFLASQIVGNYLSISIQINTTGILLAVLISIGVGIVFGLLPAIRASQKSPIEALRHE